MADVHAGVEALVERLANPVSLLVDAMQYLDRADEALASAVSAGDPAVDAVELSTHYRGMADGLTFIAKTAAGIAGGERSPEEAREGHEDDAPWPAGDPLDIPPQAAQGLRFRARLAGGRKLGVVGGFSWLWVPGVGFLCGSGGLFVSGREGPDGFEVILSGRVVSLTPRQALCITDAGIAVALPQDVVDFFSEDDR